jgi:[protein-PII] uridylyltransferase
MSPEQIREAFRVSGSADEVLGRRTALVDQLVTAAYRECLAPRFPQGLALVAVGGYGRRELFPYSDVDLLLLTSRDIQTESQREGLSAFLRSLWDSGLRLSQSVRTVPECCEFHQGNIELSVSLIDQRFLIGDSALYETLAERLPKFFRTRRPELLRHLCNLARSRHARYQNTIYHLEPNIKETPGGIRDLHLIHWLAFLRGASEPPSQRLQDAARFLAALRCRLHYESGRDNNVLTFAAQESCSEDPAEFMRQYFRHAREVFRGAQREIELSEAVTEGSLVKQFRDWRARVSNADFTITRDRVYLRTPQRLEADPEFALKLFEFVARHGMRLSLDAERRLLARLPDLERFFAQPRPIWAALRSILSLPHASLALRAMHETGLLQAIFPEWRDIECLVIRDFYHRYTVDEHTLVALEMLDSLRDPPSPAARKFSTLRAETEDLPLVYAALLFHDVGKGSPAPDHASASAASAARALARIGMPEDQRHSVLFLIEQHLTLSSVMNSRDLHDPRTIEALAHRIGTIENLKRLTLTTWADISAVNPTALTPWRGEQLWHIYVATHRELTRELNAERIHLETTSDPHWAAFLEGLPTRYLRTHSEADIRWHLQLDELRRAAGIAVDLRRREGSWRLTVLTKDRPHLFASLVGVLSSFGMDILKAEAFSNAQGVVVDTFVFADPMRTLELNPSEVDRLKLVVQRAALGKEDVRRLLKARAPLRGLPRGRIQPTVAFDSSVSDSATLIEVVAEDRPGLLYSLASAISEAGCNIEVVLIDTEAAKAIDVFYITKDGRKLDSETEASLRSALLEACQEPASVA